MFEKRTFHCNLWTVLRVKHLKPFQLLYKRMSYYHVFRFACFFGGAQKTKGYFTNAIIKTKYLQIFVSASPKPSGFQRNWKTPWGQMGSDPTVKWLKTSEKLTTFYHNSTKKQSLFYTSWPIENRGYLVAPASSGDQFSCTTYIWLYRSLSCCRVNFQHKPVARSPQRLVARLWSTPSIYDWHLIFIFHRVFCQYPRFVHWTSYFLNVQRNIFFICIYVFNIFPAGTNY